MQQRKNKVKEVFDPVFHYYILHFRWNGCKSISKN